MWLEAGAAVGGLVAGGLLAAVPAGPAAGASAACCPACGRRCPPAAFVPLALAARWARCHDCGFAVGWRSSAMAIATAALWALVAWRAASAAEVASGWALAELGVLVAATDLQWRVIPNRLTGAGALVWIPLGIWSGHAIGGLTGAVALALPLLLVALWRPAALGMGDVKLAAVAGLYLGWPLAVPGLFLSMLSASVAGLTVMAFRGRSRHTTIPLGPFLALGSLAVFLAVGR